MWGTPTKRGQPDKLARLRRRAVEGGDDPEMDTIHQNQCHQSCPFT